MSRVLYTSAEVRAKILAGEKLLVAGEEELLDTLPAGNWIGGTMPYFMGEQGGVTSREMIYVTELPSYINPVTIRTYNEESIASIYDDAPGNGLTLLIFPAFSPIHFRFALNAPNYDSFATRPLLGWISGVHLDDLAGRKPLVYFGPKQQKITDRAVAMHLSLPADRAAEINIINIFEQGSGETIMFASAGFEVTEVIINGETQNFAAWLSANSIDTRLPLVADYCGAMVNVSFQTVDVDVGRVQFYAPVFPSVEYRLAAPVGDYVEGFKARLPSQGVDTIFFSCNCILNYLYSELENKEVAGITGPITFGEIAYQLLNQTMAYATIHPSS